MSTVSERTERLICRALDGETTPDEQRELDAILLRDAAARALYHDYRRNDACAAQALHRDFERAMTAAYPRHRRGLWLATAGAVLAAAAVIALSLFPQLFSAGAPNRIVKWDPSNDPGWLPAVQTVDYKNVDYTPRQRHQRVTRDLIGVQGEDPNTIYIFERNTRSTEIVPVRGDF